MRWITTLGVAAAVPAFCAGELDTQILRLIGEEPRLIYGVELGRYEHTSLAELYPFWLGPYSMRNDAGEQVHQFISVEYGTARERSSLNIARGNFLLSRLKALAAQDGRQPDVVRGVAVAPLGSGRSGALLDVHTEIEGDTQAVHAAIDRWFGTTQVQGDVSDQVRRLSGDYDIWFLALRPLDFASADCVRPEAKYRAKFIDMVEIVQGGIRAGDIHELSLEVTAKTSEDAAGLAALGNWLPGLIQMDGSLRPEGRMVDLAENLVIRSAGRTASLTFTLAEHRLRDLVEELQTK